MDFIAVEDLKAELNTLRQSICEDIKRELREALTVAPARPGPSLGTLRQTAASQWVGDQRSLSPQAAGDHDVPKVDNETEGRVTEVVPFAPPFAPAEAKAPPLVPAFKTASNLGALQEDEDLHLLPGQLEVSSTAKKVSYWKVDDVIEDKDGDAQTEKEHDKHKVGAATLTQRARTRSFRRCSTGRLSVVDESTKCPINFFRLKKLVRTIRGQATGMQKFGLEDFVDMVVSVSIVLNGILLGLQADYQALNSTDNIPVFFAVTEIIFCAIFTLELGIKLCKYRLRLYSMPSWRWNLFDTALVSMQLGDVLMEVIFASTSANDALDTAATMKNAAFLRLLRLLRLLRILRLLRLLQFFSELNVVTAAIMSSMKSLLGTTFMLIMVMYIIGIVICQITTSHRVTLIEQGRPVPPDLVEWWGSLSRSMLSLYEAFLGGIDWDSLVQPLMNISPWLAVCFALYIAFITLAMMNVITGIFVESAIKNAEKEKDKVLSAHVRELHKMLGNTEGIVQREDFRHTMKDEELQHYFADLGIDQNAAVHLYDLLSIDREEGLTVEELVQGIIRLRESAKFLDVMTLLYEVEQANNDMMLCLDRTSQVVGLLCEKTFGSAGGGAVSQKSSDRIKGSAMLR